MAQEDIHFYSVDGVNGNPVGKITAIAQDRQGYMWFSGQKANCLYRYDGIKMIAFRNDSSDKHSLGGTDLESVYGDPSGRIWVALLTMGLDVMDSLPGYFRHFRHDPKNPASIASDTVYEVIADAKGRIWVGTANGLDLFNDHSGSFTHYRNIPGDNSSLSSNIIRATGSTVKELTDINNLADEYLRLSYHAFLSGRQGLPAKDKSFNVTLKTELDVKVAKINIIPQEIGRVLLNLFNNAFYAVAEKATRVGKDYEPAVWLFTRKAGGWVELEIRDNGIGIPQKQIDKIFQPFYTTKPTGQGTGLGLSISYDVVKAHSGEIKVDSAEGVGTTFIIRLPV